VETEPAVTPNVEREIALDLVKRGLPAAPVVILIGGLVRGWAGAASAAIAVGIVLVNFLVAAAVMTRAAKHGPGAIGGAALGSYIARLVVIVVALALLRHESWIDLPVLGLVLVGTYLGLLFWEAKYVSLTLAAPGLRPAGPGPSGEQ
jgi:hypothetical protein